MSKTVLVAPLAAEILASALTHERFARDVAFGTRQRDLDLPPGTPVFIYAAPDYSAHHALLRPGHVTWTGTLGALVPAVATGARLGMHPDARVRPPFAETYDYKDAAMFWHVHGLQPLAQPIPFERFRDSDGAALFGGFAPAWISAGLLDVQEARQERPALLQAA